VRDRTHVRGRAPDGCITRRKRPGVGAHVCLRVDADVRAPPAALRRGHGVPDACAVDRPRARSRFPANLRVACWPASGFSPIRVIGSW
jgi:hypothetical protein